MEPIIRNFRNSMTPGGSTARLVSLDDNPPTCTMTYSEIDPDQTSAHHIHPWEHEIYIIKGSGTLICDGKDYSIKEGDALFIQLGRERNLEWRCAGCRHALGLLHSVQDLFPVQGVEHPAHGHGESALEN